MTRAKSLRASTSFLFQTTKNLLFEVGGSHRIGHAVVEQVGVCAKAGGSVVVISDKGITDRGLELPACASLAELGFDVVMFDDVVADPPESTILEAVDLAKSVNAKCVIGFGGGSSMDVAKLVAFLANPACKQAIGDIYGVGNCIGSRLPLVQVPTTAGTGSEVTPISIVTTGKNEKMGVVSPILLPDLAVLDGSLLTSLPKSVTAATGIDAMVHAVEAYTSRIKRNPLSDLLAVEALRLLGSNIRISCNDADDVHTRGLMLLGSMYAGMAFANAPVGAVHALAYPVGSHFHVPHGVSNSLMLPHVLRFNSAAAADMYATLREEAFPDAPESASLADCFVELAAELGVPSSLSEVGITEQDIPLLARESMHQTRLLQNNPREVTLEDATALYEAALGKP